jgi:hypothetical protein
LPVTPPTKSMIAVPIVPVGRRGGSRRVLAVRGVLAVVMAALLYAGSTLPAVAAETCANTAVRVQSGSTGLPDCRAYEMVSSPYKEGFAVEIGSSLRFNDSGLVSYLSIGNFAGNGQGTPYNRYHATRSAAGWVTTSIAPSEVLYNTGGTLGNEAPDLDHSQWTMSRRDLPGDKAGFYRLGLDGIFTRIGDAEDPVGVRFVTGTSADLSHIVFNHGPQGGQLSDFYEMVGPDAGATARPVNVNNLGQPTESDTCPGTVSADGRVIVYIAGCGSSGPQLWARVAGSATVAVSGSECARSSGDLGGVCNGVSAAAFAGAAVDGSRVFFTSNQQLVNGDTDTASGSDPYAGSDLYACDIPPGAPAPVGAANPCAPLTEISGTASNAKVENVVAVSKDGSRVYFVAQGALADNLGVGGVGPATVTDTPQPHNLYMWERDSAHPAGQTRFVTRLGASDLGRGQTTADGRYLLFLTASKLVMAGPAVDTDDAVDAYRYDAVTKSIVRVSTSVSGSDGNGAFDVSMAFGDSWMTDDGSTVVFDSDEALSASDTDGVNDVYSWHDDGRVSLISTGGGKSLGTSSSGRDIFFTTNVPVLASDGDFNTDIYTARIGGGFAVTQTAPCAGDGCRGPRSEPPGLAGPSAPAGGGSGLTDPAPAFSLRAVSAAQRRTLAATGRATLTVTASTPGTVSVKATATIGGRSVTVGAARRTLTTPGKVPMSLSLSKSARGQLAARGRLSVRVSVSHSKVALDRSVTLSLVHAKAKAKKSARRGPAHRSTVGGDQS